MWGLGISAVLDHLGIYQPWMLWWLIVGHTVMDYLKCHYLAGWIDEGKAVLRLQDRNIPWAKDNLGLPLWIDQAWHIMQILVCLTMA
jgi:hypothetical protein